MPLTRTEVERETEWLIDQALRLADEVLVGARVTGKDLDRILLVGGPTQMPSLRAAIAARWEAKLDFSLNPMTVVARGAALYAATIESEGEFLVQATAGASDNSSRSSPKNQKLLLAYEPVSATLAATVAGRLVEPGADLAEIKVDAEGGYWTSGWSPVRAGAFELPVVLQEGKSSRFFVYSRDVHGTLIDVVPDEFSIRHGLVVSAPPLPHTIAVEVFKSSGRSELDPVIKRGTPLPAERSARYRSDRLCKVGDVETSLAIKLWEGEEFSDAEANTWVGNVKIDAREVRRSIPEGSDVELTIKIDASRLITVEAFVPHLNQHFSNKLYVAQEEERDYATLAVAVPEQTDDYRARLQRLESAVADESHVTVKQDEDVKRLQEEIDELASEAQTSASTASHDPDQAKRIVETSRNVRRKLAQLEKAVGVNPQAAIRLAEVMSASEGASAVVERFGSALEKKELQLLAKQLERALEKEDERALETMRDAFDSLRWRVLSAQDWWWREVFDSMKTPGHSFLNRAQASKLFNEGEAAIRAGSGTQLRAAVRELWKLQPRDELEQDQERALRSGLRRY
jgi:molecular chaperone DnaK